MPGLHGTELAAFARSSIPDLPVLFVTGCDAQRIDERDGEVLQRPYISRAT
jgi:FixJ family two-component response regulator